MESRTLKVSGELDIATAGEFRTEVGMLLGTGCRHLVVDFADATFIDSSGLGALVWAERRMHGAGGDLLVVNAHGPVASTLRITGVDRVVQWDGTGPDDAGEGPGAEDPGGLDPAAAHG